MLEEKGFPMQRVDRNVVSAEFRNRERKGERDTDDGTQPKKNGVMHMRTRGEKACSERSEIDEFECETVPRNIFNFLILFTNHFTRMRESFFGQICSNVSVSTFHCERTLARIDRCTEDLTLVWPETSVDGWNLGQVSLVFLRLPSGEGEKQTMR